MTVLNAPYYHNPDTCRTLLFDEAKSLYGLDCGNHLLDVNLGLAHSLLLHHELIEENFETSTCSCIDYDDNPTRFLQALPRILQSAITSAKHMEPLCNPAAKYPSMSTSKPDSTDKIELIREELSSETAVHETSGTAFADEDGYRFLFTNIIDPESIPRREPSQDRADWVIENITRIVHGEFPLQYGLLRQQLAQPMIDDGFREEMIDTYLLWSIRSMTETIVFRAGFLFPLDFSKREYRVVRGRAVDQIRIPEIALVMHRIVAGRTGMNRTDLFGKTAGIFGLDQAAIDVQVAMGGGLQVAGRYRQNPAGRRYKPRESHRQRIRVIGYAGGSKDFRE